MNHSRWNLMVLWLQSFIMTHIIDSVQTITGLHIFILVFFSLFQGRNGSRSWQLLLRAPAVHPSRVLRGSGHRSPIPPFHLERVFSETLVRGHAHPHHHRRVSVFHLYGSGTLGQTVNTKAEPKPNSGTEQTVQLSFVHQKEKWEKQRWEKVFGNSTAVNEVMLRIQSLHGDLARSADFYPFVCVWLNYFYIFWGVFDSADNVWEELWVYIW